MKRCRSIVLLFIAVAAFPTAAHAYVDPGAGSMLLQLLLGGLAGLFVFFRIFKQKISKLLGFAKDEEKQD